MPVAAVVGAAVTMLERADPGPIVAMLAQGAVLWHNNDAIEVDAAQGFVRVDGARITRVVEYLDPTFGAQLVVTV